MRYLTTILLITVFSIPLASQPADTAVIRVNLAGYKCNDIKTAVLLSTASAVPVNFAVIDIRSGRIALKIRKTETCPSLNQFKICRRLDFSGLNKPGNYKVVADNISSVEFVISDTVYSGVTDFLLKYMRQQRSGFNPFLKDSCHTHDGYEIYGYSDKKVHLDVSGGWHDAADYLQYVTTSANATYQMLFAYSSNKTASYDDRVVANGMPGKNGIADILDECRWGLEWLIKMNPSDTVMYNQIADDRDHIGFRLPDKDTAKYGEGKERPVYRCTGKPQGLFRYKNRSTGIASTAGKYASAFARGSIVFRDIDRTFSEKLAKKAIAAYDYGIDHPGVCQTAPGTAPYFYEEDNWADDMELAAAELYNLTGNKDYLRQASEFGRKEPVTPWMGRDTARHYQFYPFLNLGHPWLASTQNKEISKEFISYIRHALELIEERGKKNQFRVGIPFIWCSNNLDASVVTLAHLYRKISGDDRFDRLEAAHRDWLMGCNPWGTSMIVGWPLSSDTPLDSHSSFVREGMQVDGGLVDGPVYPSIFKSLKYIYLSGKDEYSSFQTDMAVYHDDFADYSTNECTMDGTATMIMCMSFLMPEGKLKD